eukprot:scaffold34460_cov39-Phaeocystis_antarctica.AAC.1
MTFRNPLVYESLSSSRPVRWVRWVRRVRVRVRARAGARVLAARLEEGGQLLAALVEALLREGHGGVVHLVDGHHEDTHAQRLGQHRVLARLPAAVEAGLELALACGDNEHAYIGLARARDHVGHVVLVAGRVEDGVPG